MKKMFLRVIALVLVICAMQVAFVPSVVTAASTEGEYARPVTVLDEALISWEDDRSCVANVYGDDYFVLPIDGGKMYIYNLDTQELVDEVNTGIDKPRGIVADDENDVVYLVGGSHYMYIYDLRTNKGSSSTDRFYGGGSTVYDINLGDDGKLYFGSNANRIIQYDPDTGKFTNIATGIGQDAAGYFVSSVIKKGNYIYAAVTTDSDHWLVKLDVTQNNKLVEKKSFKDTGPSTYLTHMSMTEEGIIFGGTITSLMAIDTTTMEVLSEKNFGLGDSMVPVYGYVSEKICTPDYPNGRYYFVGWKDHDWYAYDPQENTITKLGWGYTQMLCCQGKTVTLDRDGVKGEYFISFTDVQADQITYTNVETGKQLTDKGLFAGKGASCAVNSVTLGPDGRLYYGGFDVGWVGIYDPATGAIDKTPGGHKQTDALCVYEGEIYAGNYTGAMLTKLDTGNNQPETLFTLNNALFDQARIHSIVAGDNKIFLGTFPDIYGRGGVLAWYDTSNGYTYVAVGPEPADVYYSDNASDVSATWYNTQNTAVTSITVDGVVSQQSIKDVAYHNGILYAATSTYGGTNASALSGVSPVIIAYDIDAKQVIATYNFAGTDFAADMPAVGGIEVDDNGTLWGVAAETLFTLELNANKNGFIYKDHFSINKTNYDGAQARENSTILFKNGYVYVAFEKNGGICKVSKTNSSDVTYLLPDVTDNGQVPNSMAFGGDGNLYYLLGKSLKMLAINPASDDWTKASAVTNTIASAATLEDISEARQAYEQLTLTQKSLVQNYSVLEQAEVNALNAGIAELGEITWADYAQVQALLTTYKQMSRSQQNLVTSSYKLINANQTLLKLEKEGLVEVEDAQGELSYFQTLEEALADDTAVTITLRGNIDAASVILNNDTVLNLNGCILTTSLITGKVMDSQDGEGLIKVAKNAAFDLTCSDGQLILWDNTTDASGYRVFKYTFTKLVEDADGTDASESERIGMTVKSFWSDLTFENPRAYTLAAKSDLEVGFEVSWTPAAGNATSRTFKYDAKVLGKWGEAEYSECVTPEGKNYCFYITLTGFESLKVDGTVAVKPYIKTGFNTDEEEAIVSEYDYVEPNPVDILTFDQGYGLVPDLNEVA